MSPDTAENLLQKYGARYTEILGLVERDRRGGDKICPHHPDILGQIWYAVEREQAMKISDFMLRRTLIGFSACGGLDCVAGVAQERGAKLSWNQGRVQKEIEEYKAVIAQGHAYKQDSEENKGL